MPVKSVTKKPGAKVAVKKSAAAAKTTTAKKAVRKSSVKGQALGCSLCGLVVTIDEDCGCIEEHAILCCEKPMKERKRAAVKSKK